MSLVRRPGTGDASLDDVVLGYLAAANWCSDGRLMASRFRLAVRIQRFEVWSCVLFVAVVGITALIVRARLDRHRCPGRVPDAVDLPGRRLRRGALRPTPRGVPPDEPNDEAGLVMTAMKPCRSWSVSYWALGWSGGESKAGRRRPCGRLPDRGGDGSSGRLLPILAILMALLAFAAITTEVLAAAKVPWQLGPPSFDDAAGARSGGRLVASRPSELALAIGAWSGRMLPTILLSALVALFLAIGGRLLLEAWVEAYAHDIDVPSWFNGEYDGGRFVGSFYRLPDGSEFSDFDIFEQAPAGVDPYAWVAQLPVAAIGVHAPDYPGWVATESRLRRIRPRVARRHVRDRRATANRSDARRHLGAPKSGSFGVTQLVGE